MTEVLFYVVSDGGADAAVRLACRVAEKAQGQGHRVFLHTDEAGAAQRLDELLWTFRQGSFVPHALADELEGPEDPTPVAIGAGGQPPARFDDVLINLGTEVPDFFSRFQRAVEIVTPETRGPARQRYKFYQDRGYPLATHHV